MRREQLRFQMEGNQQVSGLLMRPGNARSMLVLAHGAGAGMTHPFMEKLADVLAGVGIATFRYQFPYIEKGRRIPDRPEVLTATVIAAVRAAGEMAAGLLLLAGGKSMGGRMTSQAAAVGSLPGVAGLVFFGFPLHPPNRPGTKRADHLVKVSIPMLFMQGERDTLADLGLLRPICASLEPRSTLHIVERADHSFHVPKSSGRSDDDVFQELAQTAAHWEKGLGKS